MNSKRTASIFKDSSKVSYVLAKSLETGSKVLIVDGLDGWHVFPFVSYGHYVETYEPEKIYVDGGVVADSNGQVIIHGLRQRIYDYEAKSKVTYHLLNFYEQDEVNKYDLVHVYKSLHRECHKEIPMERKVRKLQDAVSDDGEIYIYYHLAINDEDYLTYPKNQYLRTNEMMSYFDLSEWDIVMIRERNKLRRDDGHYGHPKPHLHRIGYIHAKRKSKKCLKKVSDDHEYHFSIKVGKTYF